MLLYYNDLLNIADTNTQLKQAADTVFERKFGEKKFCLNRRRPTKAENFFNITELKSSLQTLRCFGHLITKLEVNSTTLRGSSLSHLFRYTTEYCSESLVELSLNFIPDN